MGEQMNEHGWVSVCMVQLAMMTTVEGHQSQTGLAGSEISNMLVTSALGAFVSSTGYGDNTNASHQVDEGPPPLCLK